jgi:hypothetical protein
MPGSGLSEMCTSALAVDPECRTIAVPVPRPVCGTLGPVVTRLKSQRRMLLSSTTMVPDSAAALAISKLVTGIIAAASAAPHAPMRVHVCIGSPLLVLAASQRNKY